MDIKEIKELIALMNEHNLIEIEIEKEGKKIRLKKDSQYNATPIIVKENISKKDTEDALLTKGKEEIAPSVRKTVEIKSPMIGTFYRSPHPDAPPFVEIGDIIEPGKVICIIEAMKLMNEIKAEIKGKIVQVLVNNGDPVEFGQPLFLVEPIP